MTINAALPITAAHSDGNVIDFGFGINLLSHLTSHFLLCPLEKMQISHHSFSGLSGPTVPNLEKKYGNHLRMKSLLYIADKLLQLEMMVTQRQWNQKSCKNRGLFDLLLKFMGGINQMSE